MPWVKLDDQFADHPKIVACGPLASWLYVCGLGYCCRLLTDGFIPEGQVRKLADVEDAKGLAENLVEVNLWERCDGGYRVHDYHDYQPTREKALAIREMRAEAGSRGGKQKASNLLEVSQGDARPFAKQNSTPYPSRTRTHPDPIPDAETHVSASGADALTRAEEPLPPPKFPKPKDAPVPLRPPDLLFEAVCEACDIDWRELTDPERGKLNAAVGQIRKAGGSPATVREHAENYTLLFNAPLTPSALAGNWAKTANPPPARASPNGYHGKPTAAENAAAAKELVRQKREGGNVIEADFVARRF
jgi:hypothetical protein